MHMIAQLATEAECACFIFLLCNFVGLPRVVAHSSRNKQTGTFFLLQLVVGKCSSVQSSALSQVFEPACVSEQSAWNLR